MSRLATLLLACLFFCHPLPLRAGEAPERLPAYQKRFERERPLVAVIGENRMTELVDYVLPYGLLKRSGVAEVVALSTRPGPMQMMPALHLLAEADIDGFDRRHPEGADYIVVPAVHHSDDPQLLRWVRQQAAKGATVVGICDGALVLGEAGLLEGRRATGHWYSRGQREDDFPGTRWVSDRRYLADGKVITTAGVSAAMPVSIALVEAIAGTDRAQALATGIGLADWSPRHDGDAFALGAGGYLAAAGNLLSFWRHEELGLEVRQGEDELALALRADAWSRTFRSEVLALAADASPIRTASGLVLLPEPMAAHPGITHLQPTDAPLARLFDQTLGAIAARYDQATAALVAAQLEYAPALNE
ncbi:DJ-1/PfpI family protein [Pseudomonas tohonis]|nr:hypothetical protein L682_13380 [Pseudomonas alcaligenes OT 69]MDN4144150.1 DJ-1/PfpI family protein [Pseudomonas tohonis]